MLVGADDSLGAIAPLNAIMGLGNVGHYEKTEHAFAELPNAVLNIIKQTVDLLHKGNNLLFINDWLEVYLSVDKESCKYTVRAAHLPLHTAVELHAI